MLHFHGVFLLRVSSSLTITEAYSTTLALWAQETLRCRSRREEAQASVVTWPSLSRDAAAKRDLTPHRVPGARLYLDGHVVLHPNVICDALKGSGKEKGKGAFICKEEYLIESCCGKAQARLWAGVREQSFAGSSRPKGVFPSWGSGFGSSEKGFVSPVIGRKSHMKIGLKSCTRCQLECKLLWENLRRSAILPCRNQRNW